VSIQEELQHVKAELSSDEKILENAFKLERLYKKNKGLIWTVVAVALIGLGGNAAWQAYQRNKLESANAALLKLQADPKDSAALQTLQTNNPKLYALFSLSQALHQNKASALEPFLSDSDELIADLARYHAGVLSGKPTDSTYYHDLSVLEEAWAALQAGKPTQAHTQLSLIGETSPVAKVAQLLKHYTALKH